MDDNYFRDIGKYLHEIQAIDTMFQDWDYKPTIVPMIDAYAPYETLKDANISHSYRMLDRNGDLLLLRADSTLFLARMVSKHVQRKYLPLRLCYSNSVIQPTKEIKNNELRQNGIELIGVSNISGDFEILLLTHTALESIAPSQYCIHIGSREIIKEAVYLQKPDTTKDELHTIYQLCSQRDYHTLGTMFESKFAQTILNIMEVDNFKLLSSAITSLLPNNSPAFETYTTLIEALSNVIDPKRIRCDFSEVGNHDYYTNIVFSAYAKDAALPAAQGGRYDDLMKHFGAEVPAVGASLFPHVLMPYLLQTPLTTHHEKQTHTTNTFNALSDIVSPSVQELIHCASAQTGIPL